VAVCMRRCEGDKTGRNGRVNTPRIERKSFESLSGITV
jgi:hypothetical protein